jgi:type I restriction enzyme M protein
MDKERQLIVKTERMIDDLKAVCGEYGLSNTGNEYKIIADSFLYKYLNDKFLYEFKRVDKNLSKTSTTKEVEEEIMKLSPAEMSKYRYGLGANVAFVRKEFLVSYLFNNKNSTTPKFYELFDNALDGISNDNIDIFSVRTGSKEKIKLFSPISQYIIESNKKNDFAKAIIDKLVEFSFDEVFEEKYDFFATIFEYLIKDYNKDFGKYAEYYTPNSIARIIAKILVPDTDKVRNVSIYDPSAGSGTLLLALAHEIGEEDCTLYTQDISQKSNEFLRLNLILNNLVHSLDNVVHGNTLLNPAHLNKEGNRLAQFDYIVSNPPFKTDFSDYRDKLEDDKYSDRFFAGVPKIPNKDKDKMAIYLLFIQHILYSLKEDGRAAIVVPTGFITASNGIEIRIKQEIINNGWLRGVISMPSNIFATTGTNVSILFIDKSKTYDNAILVDASKLGIKTKDGKNQKTILSYQDILSIENTFINNHNIDDFSVLVNKELIISKKYSLSAGEYFKIKMPEVHLDKKEFDDTIKKSLDKLNKIYIRNHELELEINKKIGDINYED